MKQLIYLKDILKLKLVSSSKYCSKALAVALKQLGYQGSSKRFYYICDKNLQRSNTQVVNSSLKTVAPYKKELPSILKQLINNNLSFYDTSKNNS